MRNLICLFLLANAGVAGAEGFRKPAFWSSAWQYEYATLAKTLKATFEAANADAETEIRLREVGETLGALNVLAQNPCRVNETYCRVELEYLIRDAVVTATREMPAETEAQIERRYKVLLGLTTLTNDHLLKAHAVNARKTWERDRDSEPYLVSQVGGTLILGTVVAGLAAYFGQQGLWGTVAIAASGFVASAVALASYVARAPYFPLTSKFDVPINAVAGPVNDCVNQLTPTLNPEVDQARP